jgi:hypothetical protein
MSGESAPAAEDRAWDLLSREEEATLAWIRDLWEEGVVRHGRADAPSLLAALVEAGAVAVGAVGTGAMAARHGFRRDDVEFSIETSEENSAQIQIRFGRLGS